ncbi:MULTISPECIES: hypothetical protein [unclassified Mycolicibacterium]|uniref:hypothetical protein n=1 Tax=unclassified Mycolicibacterium TaxID=2636767 RepID=UPI0012DD472F|nr:MULTISPECIES: hypothetical protein [unclassified Mycolicibacterium]MUL80861.1 hypothetical protein [Mycolicibacterium sp. CBMA 329]MUL86627.1 hypothetical protein [Mycolicibacterium sp. CBMA 331]MUM02831.1 hypothetical protein [Mycolicibacterium sp. CBMA 334]MUM27677.1 hypothetical protein [Mycolicibacterium sp. CBMA 295]MUM36924.1 hypothetical protein [Mycolicibacterium sp. CBMA 247]
MRHIHCGPANFGNRAKAAPVLPPWEPSAPAPLSEPVPAALLSLFLLAGLPKPFFTPSLI